MSGPAGVLTGMSVLLVLLAVLVTAGAEKFVCGVADLNDDGAQHVKPFTCDNLGEPAPDQSKMQEIPADKFPWIGTLLSTTSNQKTCLGVVVSQDLVVASQPCEISASYTFELSHLNFTSHLSVVPTKAGVNSENDMLLFKLMTHIPADIYRPACVPDQHFVPKAVKATDSCQEKTNTLLKVSLKDGNIVPSYNSIVADTECANNILDGNSECWNNFDFTQNPCMTRDQTIQKHQKHKFQNYEDYTCHRGILQAAEKCNLDGIIGEAKCVGTDENSCIGHLPNTKDKKFHKCRKEVAEYSECITNQFIEITNDYSEYPFSGVNCLHSYLPNRPECAKHPSKQGLASLGSKWGFNGTKAFQNKLKACKKKNTWKQQQVCELNKTATYDWMKRKPYQGKWSISMIKEVKEVSTCIVNATGCNICGSTGGSVCIEQNDDGGETEFIFWYESCRDRWFFLGPSTAGKRNKICTETEMIELPFLEQNTQLIREYASEHSEEEITILPLYPKPVIVMLGNTGVGKSTVANALLMGHARNKECFKTSSGASSQTKLTKLSKAKWLGVGHCVTIIDTPGTQDTGGKQRDYENVMNIMGILKDEVKQIDLFLVLFNGMDARFGQGIQAALNTYEAIFGDSFWKNVVTEFTFWKYFNSDIRDKFVNSHCKELKQQCFNSVNLDEEESCGSEVCHESIGGGESASGDKEDDEEYEDYEYPDGDDDVRRRRKRSVGHKNPYCTLMLEDERSFSLNTSFEDINSSHGVVSENFWDSNCGWKELPQENEYPDGWDKGSKDLYNKADFINRYIKANRWNEKYEEKMKVTTVPSVFINPLWNKNALGCERFQRETNKLWNIVDSLKPYSCTDKCEAPESYFVGKPHIFGPDTIYIDKSTTTIGSRLHCSVWSGIEGSARTIDVEWYHSNNKLLQPSNDPTDLYGLKIKENDKISSSGGGGPKDHQTVQLIINVLKITPGDSGLYYCFLENHTKGEKPAMKRGKLVTPEMISNSYNTNTSIIITCDIFKITKEQMKAKLPDVKWYFAKKLEHHKSKYDMSLDSQAKHDQFSIQKLTFEEMDESYEGNYACKVSSQFSDEVKVKMNIDATWTEWGSWSSCSVTCGNGGLKRQKRTCNPPKNKGITCDALAEKASEDRTYAETKETSCEYICCPVDGMWSKWQSWSSCSQKCFNTTDPNIQNGEKTRERTCNEPSKDCGGKDCNGSRREVLPCNIHKCPINGEWSAWSSWSDCIKDPAFKCSGTLKSIRSCTNPAPQYEGRKCPNFGVQTQNCEPVCAVDCKATNWGDWSDCSKTCKQYKSMDQGTIRRHRGSVPAANNGKTCEEQGIVLEESKLCTVDKICPRESSWGEWGDYEQCDTETGKQRRERTCFFEDSKMQETMEMFNTSNAFDGHGCVGKPVEYSTCPVDCQCNTEWTKWDTCLHKCNKPTEKWKRKRRRSCIPAKNNGKACTDVDRTQEDDCPIPRCPYVIQGMWSEWGGLSPCPAECGGGTQTKKRSCTHPEKDIKASVGDYDPNKDILQDCAGKGIEKHDEKCNVQSCAIKSLTFVMDVSCSFDKANQNASQDLASELMIQLMAEKIEVPKYQVISSPGASCWWDDGVIKCNSVTPEVLDPKTLPADFIVQYTNTLTRDQCGLQLNLDVLLDTLEHHAKDGAVIVLFTDDGTYEVDKDEVTKQINKQVKDKQATIVIFITPVYIGNKESMIHYRDIAENRVYEMDKREAKDVIGIVKRNLQKKGGGTRCIAAGGPLWPIEKYECQFPFKYEGVDYHECTNTDHVQTWCSTYVDADLRHKDGEVGLCGDCSGFIDPICSNYKILNESNRNLKDLNRGSNNDHLATWSGYYRFETPAGIKLPGNGNDVQKTEAWIQKGHPKVNDKVELRSVCFGQLCKHSKQIRTITCPSNRGEEFHLYELEKPQIDFSYVAQEGTCPTDWVTIRTNCIYVSALTDKLMWEDAKKSCKSKGGELFEPQNENINEKVWKYVKLTVKMNETSHYWLGFNDVAKEGEFRSVITSDVRPLSDFPWLAGSPHEDNTLNCINVITKSGKWTDSSCDTLLHYICQRDQNS